MLLNREIGIPSLQGLEQRVEVLARPRVRKVPEVGVERDSQRAFLARLVVQVDAEASIQAERQGVVRTGSALEFKQRPEHDAPDRVDPPQVRLPD